MTVPWTPVFVLPNIDLKVAIGCEVAALAPAKDKRVVTIRKAHANFDKFLNRFSDNFGEKFKPSILLVRSDAPKAFLGTEALSSFRDAIAISCIAYNRASHLVKQGGLRVFYGEYFSIYPWMLDKHFEDLIGNTPAMLGNHDVAKFKGQSSPTIFRKTLDKSLFDNALLDELFVRWVNRYSSKSPSWADLALFRSLNMAYQALLMPAGSEATFLDVGRLISLWVSAFEILVHPGGIGKANLDKVFELIEQTPWLLKASSALIHETTGKSANNPIKRTLASFIYDRMYRCRNNFLHGNPVGLESLVLPSGRLLFVYAAPLYRIGLTSFLPLVLEKPADMNVNSIASHVSKSIDFNRPQKEIENAILTATKPPE